MQTPRTRLATEDRQAETVKAVLALAARRSPGSITTAEMASAMGLTQGAVFRHFATKEAIWLAVADWIREELLGRLNEAARSQAEPLAALAAVFRAHVAFVLANPGAPRLIFHELQEAHESAVKRRVAQLLQAYRALLVSLLRQAQAAGHVAADLDLASACAMFIGAIQGLVMQSMLSGSAEQMVPQGEGMLTLYFSAIRVKP
ncbi:MAG: TetR family transcriptional regulator [Rhodocyclaceae bacterium]|nr:TetR family transcriptional regulator [Rhodocyclaceae bacterium]